MRLKTAYQIDIRPFEKRMVEDDWEHTIFQDPFIGNETEEMVLEIIRSVADSNAIAYNDSYAFNYAMKKFPHYDFDYYVLEVFHTEDEECHYYPNTVFTKNLNIF